MGHRNRRKTQLDGRPAEISQVPGPSTPQASDTKNDVPAGLQVDHRVRKTSLLKRVKKIAWRVTGVYFWLWLISLFFLGAGTVSSAQDWLAYKVSAVLSGVGFAPVNGKALPIVLKVGWLLTITDFNLIQIVGFAIYVISAPIWVPFALGLRNEFAEALAANPGVTESRSRWSALPLCTTALIGWFVVYGEAASIRPISVGVVLSGSVLLLFIYRALQRTKPVTLLETSILRNIERFAAAANAGAVNEKKNPTSKRSDAAIHLRIHGWFHDPLLALTAYIRGQQGRDRIYMFVLVEYILFLFMLAIAAILFWALVAKAATAPQYAPLSTFFYFSASHFLPGISPPTTPSPLPPWVQAGPALTAWILFVIFVGPAASLVPIRQNAYGTRLAATYIIYRKSILSLSAYLRKMKMLKQTLPP